MGVFVLVVDDDGVSASCMEQLLQRRGFEVEVASGGAQALEAVARRRPDVVVLDLVMPGVGGMEVLDRIKATPRLTSIPVILVTARADDEDLIAGYKFGADYYITKPFTAHELLYGIGLVLGRELPASLEKP